MAMETTTLNHMSQVDAWAQAASHSFPRPLGVFGSTCLGGERSEAEENGAR